MANTIVGPKNKTIEIGTISEDWSYTSLFDWGMRLEQIEFIPGAGGEYVVIKEGDASGPVMSRLESTTEDPVKDDAFSGSKRLPFLDYSACSVASGGAKVIIRWK